MGKITINYDFFEQILNAREDFNSFKVIRTNRKFLTGMLGYAFCTDYILFKDMNLLVPKLVFDTLWVFSVTYCTDKLGNDIYKRKADRNLSKLLPMLNDINVSTNYELLMDSYLDSKNYKIQKNDDNKKVLVENKYIMVPTHNPIFNDEGQTQMTSIHQEHIVGTNEYSLSVGLNQKNKQKVLSPLLSTAKR